NGRRYAGLGGRAVAARQCHSRRRGAGQRTDVPHPAWLARSGPGPGGCHAANGGHRRYLVDHCPAPWPRRPQASPKPALSLAQGDIEIRNVRFAYPGGRIVFEDFNLHIPAGQKVGVVGRSGAGKSTLLALIQRLDDVQGGAVLIDGQDISEVSQDSVRDRLAVVPQEAALFNRSIRENIRYGRPSATDAEVVEAARNAFCDAFIRELPQGYDTLVGERGVMLSGGQRQRLGIARAFLKDAPILILDEATSALDTRSEGEIQTALAKLMMGRTVVSVAHR